MQAYTVYAHTVSKAHAKCVWPLQRAVIANDYVTVCGFRLIPGSGRYVG